MPDLFSINRNALVIRPKASLIEWVNSVYPEDQIELEAEISNDSLEIFLIPDFESTQEAQAWLEENYHDIFVYVIENWCEDESLWPNPLSWSLFEDMLEYTFHKEVVDSVAEEEEDDDDDDFFEDDDFYEDFEDEDDDNEKK